MLIPLTRAKGCSHVLYAIHHSFNFNSYVNTYRNDFFLSAYVENLSVLTYIQPPPARLVRRRPVGACTIVRCRFQLRIIDGECNLVSYGLVETVDLQSFDSSTKIMQSTSLVHLFVNCRSDPDKHWHLQSHSRIWYGSVLKVSFKNRASISTRRTPQLPSLETVMACKQPFALCVEEAFSNIAMP